MFFRIVLCLVFLNLLPLLRAQVTAFKSGERLTYSVSYAATGATSKVAEVNLTVNKVSAKGKLFYQLVGTAQTYSNYDRVFRINNRYSSIVWYKGLGPVKHTRDTYEGGAQRKDDYVFKNGVAKVKTIKKGSVSDPNKATRSYTETVSISNKVKDILGALYYLRASPLSRVPKGKSIKLPIIFDGKVRNLSLRFDGIRSLNTSFGKKNCYKFSTSARGDKNSFSGSVYFTADANKVPVLIEANIPVGKGLIKLTGASGLRN